MKIPRGLFSTVTTAEPIPCSTIFFVAVNTVSVGKTVTILTMSQVVTNLYCVNQVMLGKFITHNHIIYHIKSMTEK